MTKKPMVRGTVIYDSETGKFYRVSRNHPEPRPANMPLDKDGYHRIYVKHANYSAARYAWFLTYGRWPDGIVDHINGDRTDNRIANLREVTPAQSAQNRRPFGANLKGAYWAAHRGKWTSKIVVNHQAHYLGAFDTEEEAHRAYREASRRLHGEYGRAA